MAQSASDAYLLLIAEIRTYLMRNGIENVTQGMERVITCLLSQHNTQSSITERSRLDNRTIKKALDELVCNGVIRYEERKKYVLRDKINVHNWVPLPVAQLIQKIEESEKTLEEKNRLEELEKKGFFC